MSSSGEDISYKGISVIDILPFLHSNFVYVVERLKHIEKMIFDFFSENGHFHSLVIFLCIFLKAGNLVIHNFSFDFEKC